MALAWKNQVSKLLTVAYLVSAAVVTVATSKMPDGSGTVTGGISNYSVQSNCTSRAIMVSKIHVVNSLIQSTLDADGVVRTTTAPDFTKLGFPNPSVLVGTDQYGSGDSANLKCLVRAKSSSVNPTYDSAQSDYSFLSPGLLTTVTYDCYDSGSYQCSTNLSELPAPAFGAVH